jgi:hypothetical protein
VSRGWEKFLHESTLAPLVTIALARYHFEAVHLFLDGNGRVGRLLMTLFLIERHILPTPLLYLSAFFEASRRDYYDGLRGISERGAGNDWLEYFLLGVARMSEDALSRAMRINGLLAECQRRVSGESSNNPSRVVELLGANPFITTKRHGGQVGDRVYDRAARHRTTRTYAYRKACATRSATESIARLLSWISSKSRHASSRPTTNSREWSQTRRAGNEPGETAPVGAISPKLA